MGWMLDIVSADCVGNRWGQDGSGRYTHRAVLLTNGLRSGSNANYLPRIRACGCWPASYRYSCAAGYCATATGKTGTILSAITLRNT